MQMQHQIYNCSHVISFIDHSFFLFLPGFQINNPEVQDEESVSAAVYCDPEIALIVSVIHVKKFSFSVVII